MSKQKKLNIIQSMITSTFKRNSMINLKVLPIPCLCSDDSHFNNKCEEMCQFYLFFFFSDKNLGNFLVRSAFKSDNQPGTFMHVNTVKISGTNRSAKVTDHALYMHLLIVILCITCTLWKKIYIGEIAFANT